MASSRFAKRLQRIRNMTSEGKISAEEKISANTSQNQQVLPSELLLRGWEFAREGFFERSIALCFPDFPCIFAAPLSLLFPREGNICGEFLLPRLRFFDLETTGLSRGAGTLAFMISIGYFKDDRGNFCLTQLILADYSGEAEFLERIAVLMNVNGDDAAVPVSFNGKCFDSQILQTRYLLNGIRPPAVFSGLKKFPHLDLLHPCRRLWRGCFGSCRLSDIEERVLNERRAEDLPGSEAPDAWFAWLRRKDTEKLALIGEHNKDDCLSLVKILHLLDSISQNPADTVTINYGSLGSLYLAAGRKINYVPYIRTAELLLRRSCSLKKPALLLAAWLRRTGRWLEAEDILLPFAKNGDSQALRMLAVDAEYRTKDYPLALSYARSITDTGAYAAKRIERLLRRMNLE